jgi:hypothetical protein
MARNPATHGEGHRDPATCAASHHDRCTRSRRDTRETATLITDGPTIVTGIPLRHQPAGEICDV